MSRRGGAREQRAALGLFLLALLAFSSRCFEGGPLSPAPFRAVAKDASGGFFWTGDRLLEGTVTSGRAPTGSVAGWQGLLFGRKLSLATAGVGDLEALPGVGKSSAQAIADWRGKNGSLNSMDDLLAVKGFGEKRAKALEPWLQFGGE